MKLLFTYLRQLMSRIPYKQILFFTLIVGTSYALAQGTPAGEPQSDSDVIRAIVQILNLVFTLITFLLTPAIILAGWLLSPDWTMGDFFGLRPYFINVWILVSNLVYIVFALMLLWMAVMQIFSSESNYAFKKKLPRFLVGIMIVPFTWLIVSWTLSFANQAVAAVLSIPAGAIGGVSGGIGADGDTGLFHKKTIPKKFVLDFGEDSPGAGSETTDCKASPEKCISPAEFIAFNESGPFFIIMVYAYDIFKIQNTEQVNFEAVCAGGADVKQCVNSIGKLLRKFGVALITTTFFAIILIALCWVLLARAFKLWIYVMFSPLFGLAYAVSDEGLGKTLESEGGGEGASLGKVGFVPFFQLAMVPVLVSAVLSFGLLFIGVMNNTFTTGSMAPTGSGGFCTKGDFMVKYCIEEDGNGGYSSRLIIGNSMNPSGGEYNITFEFGSMISDFVGNSAGGGVIGGAAGGLAEVGTDIFAHIILSIIAIAVMWMGVKAAVSYDEVTQKAFAPFAKLGDSVGNFVQNIPSYLPTPHPALAALTPGGATALAGISNKFQEEKQTEHKNSLSDTLGGKTSEFQRSMDEFGNDEASFKDSVRTFKNTATKSPVLAAELIDKGVNKFDKTGLTEEEKVLLDEFQKAVKEASNSSEKLAKVMDTDKYQPIMGKLEAGNMGGLKELGTAVGSVGGSGGSNTGKFAGYNIVGDKIETGNGNPFAGQGLLESGEKEAIKSQFRSIQAIRTMDARTIKDKLRSIDFQQSQLDKISTVEQARAIAEELAGEAGIN